MEFKFVQYNDDTWHLIFEDWLHGNDVNIQINADGTFTKCDFEDAEDDADIDDLVWRFTPIENLYDFLLSAHGSQMKAEAEFEKEQRKRWQGND